MNTDDVYIIIPAKDEGKRIGKVISKVLHEGFHNIVVVNDGSTDNTKEVATALGATVLTHYVCLGAGAATQTGMDYAVRQKAGIVVTIDGDDQHCPSDIKSLVHTMRSKQLDVVIGSRFLNKENEVPFIRIVFNKVGNLFTGLLTGLFVTDSQSGFKAMHTRFVERAKINLNGYEFCTEIINMIKLHKASFAEVPIKVTYTKESREKGQNFFNGVKMVGTLIKHFL